MDKQKVLQWIDEVLKTDGWIESIVRLYPDVVMGESSTEHIDRLVKCGVKNITFTSYGWHLFRIFGLNIRMPFTSQLRTWEYLEKKYGSNRPSPFYWYNPETNVLSEPIMYDCKFNHCWIMLDQIKHFPKLIKWCKDHNKTIGLVAPDKWTGDKQDNDKIYRGLKEVIKYL